MRSQISQEKNAKSHTEPPAFEWAIALLKAAHVWGESAKSGPNLYIATFGKGIPPKSVGPTFGKVKIIGKSAHVASGWFLQLENRGFLRDLWKFFSVKQAMYLKQKFSRPWIFKKS